MKFVDLKLTTPEAEKEMGPVSTPETGPRYPYGMCIYLDDLTLEKLGKKASDFEIGEAITLQGMGKVTGISIREREGGEAYSSVDIQITEVAVAEEDEGEEESAPPTRKSVGERMYGED